MVQCCAAALVTNNITIVVVFVFGVIFAKFVVDFTGLGFFG